MIPPTSSQINAGVESLAYIVGKASTQVQPMAIYKMEENHFGQ